MFDRFLINMARRVAETRFVSRITEGVDLHSDNRLSERGILAQAFEFKKINNVRGIILNSACGAARLSSMPIK